MGAPAVIGFTFGTVSRSAVGSGMFVIAALNAISLRNANLRGGDAAIRIVNSVSRNTASATLGLPLICFNTTEIEINGSRKEI